MLSSPASLLWNESNCQVPFGSEIVLGSAVLQKWSESRALCLFPLTFTLKVTKMYAIKIFDL
jgi:hypothetical protein